MRGLVTWVALICVTAGIGSVLNSPFGGMIPPYASPSKLQLLDTLDELIQKEKDLKALADQLVSTTHVKSLISWLLHLAVNVDRYRNFIIVD